MKFPKKLKRAALITRGRSRWFSRIIRSPSLLSRHIFCRCLSTCGFGSYLRITPILNADNRNESASNPIVRGAPSNCTSAPALPGPPISASASLIPSLLFASTNCSVEMSDGRNDSYATLKKTVSTPVNPATIYSCPRCRVPNSVASGIEPSRTARPISTTIKIGRRRKRSTHTPATNPNTNTAAPSSALKMPICVGVAASTKTAVSGKAIPVIPLPKLEIVCPTHNFTKSPLSHKPFRCHLMKKPLVIATTYRNVGAAKPYIVGTTLAVVLRGGRLVLLSSPTHFSLQNPYHAQ